MNKQEKYDLLIERDLLESNTFNQEAIKNYEKNKELFLSELSKMDKAITDYQKALEEKKKAERRDQFRQAIKLLSDSGCTIQRANESISIDNVDSIFEEITG